MRSLVKQCRFMVLPMSLNPGAAAQGALAVEIRRDNEVLGAMCARLSDVSTVDCVEQERAILASHGGGCHQKIGISILAREYGRVISLRGLTDAGEVLEQWAVENATPWARAAFRDDIFPVRARENSWFDRIDLEVKADLSAKAALFVARTEALPRAYRPPAAQYVWTAGVQTWMRLAKLGIWVHGSFEGLGESESPGLEPLIGDVGWAKLSHTRGYARPGTELLATYQLVPKQNHPDLTGKTHFFWMSSTSFERARQLFPAEVNNGFNAAGPGSTFDYIRRLPGLKHPPKVFIGLEQFLAETAPLGKTTAGAATVT